MKGKKKVAQVQFEHFKHMPISYLFLKPLQHLTNS